MRGCCYPSLLFVALLIGTLSPAPCQADSATVHETLAHCLSVIDRAGVGSSDGIRALCPDLREVLTDSDSGLATELGSDRLKNLDRTALADLEWLTRRYGSRPASSGPDTKSLAQIAQQLRQTQANPSWWDRFVNWLRHFLESTRSRGPGWFERLLTALSRAPQKLWTLIEYTGGALLVVMTAVLVWREVRIAREGLRRAQPRDLGAAPYLAGAAAAVTLNEVDAAPRLDQPVLLLRLLVQSLLATGRLSNDRSLTYLELVRDGRFDDDEQQQRFARVSRLAERRVYGSPTFTDGAAAQPEFDQVIAEGRQLYARLATVPRAAS